MLVCDAACSTAWAGFIEWIRKRFGGIGALLGLNRSLARDYGPQGVRVNTVSPGWVRTPMAEEEMQPLILHYGDSLDAA